MSKAYEFLPVPLSREGGVVGGGVSGEVIYNTGDAILSPESYLEDSDGDVAFQLLPTGTAFTAEDHPNLAILYPTLITPSPTEVAGSLWLYQIVGDFEGGITWLT